MEDAGRQPETSAVRWGGITFGVVTHVYFLVTIWLLFDFLYRGRSGTSDWWFAIDLVLALQFSVLHSLVLHPSFKSSLTYWIKPEWYGLFFCLTTCGCLGLVFVFWRSSPHSCWEFHGSVASGINVAFYGSWVALFYSLHLSGLGYQTGFTPWFYWLVRKSPPRRPLVTHSLYR